MGSVGYHKVAVLKIILFACNKLSAHPFSTIEYSNIEFANFYPLNYDNSRYSKKNILVCDDDQDILDMIKDTLQRNPTYEIVSFDTGNAVLEYVKTNLPPLDLMILDLWLPDIDSDEMIPIIRQDATTKDIPIMLISAIVNVEIIADELGVEASLSKPFLLEELEYKVEQLLSN